MRVECTGPLRSRLEPRSRVMLHREERANLRQTRLLSPLHDLAGDVCDHLPHRAVDRGPRTAAEGLDRLWCAAVRFGELREELVKPGQFSVGVGVGRIKHAWVMLAYDAPICVGGSTD